jgi:hypothetical protein
MSFSRTLGTIAATAALTIGGAAAYAGAQVDGNPWVVSVTGNKTDGYVKTYNTGEITTYPPLGQERRRCWRLGGGETTEYCLGLLDGTYPLLVELKVALQQAHQ